MIYYIVKRLLILPLTLFAIVLVNFVIINLAPGEPVYFTQIGATGDVTRSAKDAATPPDEKYLQFREFFGLTLPVIFNTSPWIKKDEVLSDLKIIATKKNPYTHKELSSKKYSELRIRFGDRARYILPLLIQIMNDDNLPNEIKALATSFFIRGGIRFIHLGSNLSEKELRENDIIAKNNNFLDRYKTINLDEVSVLDGTIKTLTLWYQDVHLELTPDTNLRNNLKIAFFDTRFSRYLYRTLRLDFGVLREDPNRTVIEAVTSRIKYSLTLTLLPMIFTFFLCLFFGLLMAIYRGRSLDLFLTLIFLLLYAIPIYVVAPFLIEKVALNHNFPFTDIPFPIRGFSSDTAIYSTLTSFEKLKDIALHITLPIITILYGSLAIQTRLSKAVFIDVLHQDYIRAALAKGVDRFSLYVNHVGRNAVIPLVTSIAASLGALLGGSLIVETLFEIHGFGQFFYDAIINRDYNVMMFSALMGSFLSLIGYLAADIIYMIADPRVTMGSKKYER